LKGSSQEGSR
jgi:hypothetical protein